MQIVTRLHCNLLAEQAVEVDASTVGIDCAVLIREIKSVASFCATLLEPSSGKQGKAGSHCEDFCTIRTSFFLRLEWYRNY